MKKLVVIFFVLISNITFSQVITINDTRTADDLVRNVLVNSPCVTIPPTITSSTGTNFGSTNGIGYFQNTNPAFPLSSGVILTTGNVLNSPGPNTNNLSDGLLAWPGDTQLEATLLAAGITMNSRNASYLQFEFTSFSTSFNFQFVFASEEYGNFQCQSPDGFAFLLTDTVTGITQNIAVVPSTSTPISVRTVRNELYNSSCLSANPTYFGNFNGGSNAPLSATNFEGQTILMNAGSTLIPNRTYRLKLVIADGNDNQYDSAVFIGGSSFDFTQDVLGPDLTIANGTALCNNNGTNLPYTITSGLDPALFDFIWKDAAGNPILGETGPNLTINNPGTYQLTYFVQATNCEVETNDIIIEYQSGLTTPNPIDLHNCNNGSANYTFDLSFNSNIVNPSGTYTVSYHNNSAEANTGSNPISTSQTVASGSLPREIWVRIFNATTGCYSVKSFFLRLTPAPILNNPGNQTSCETSPGSDVALFDLASLTNVILGLQSSSIYNVSYHISGSDAINDTGLFDFSLPTGDTTIGIRIENTTDPTCFSTRTIDLIVKPRPTLDLIQDQYVCVRYILPTLTNPGTYYTGPNASGSILAPGTPIITNMTIYIHHNSGGTPSCANERSFRVNIVGIQDVTPANVRGCDSAVIPDYIYPGTRYYLNSTHTQEILPGASITTLGITTIYVVFTYTDPSCTPVSGNFTVTINQIPVVSSTFTNLFDCTQINSLSPVVSDIGTGNYYTYDTVLQTYNLLTFPVTTTTHVYAFAENNGCRSAISEFDIYIGSLGLQPVNLCSGIYTLTAPAVGEFRDTPNGGGNIITTPRDYTDNPTIEDDFVTIHHYIPGQNCTNDDSFTITFYQPTLTTPNDPRKCGNFVLPSNPYLPTIVTGIRYFELPGGPSNPANNELLVGHNITSTTIVYIYKESTNPQAPAGCYKEVPWTITINPLPLIDPIDDEIDRCYQYILTQPTNGNYFDEPYDSNNPSAHTPISDLTITAADLNSGDDIINRIKILYIANVNPNDPTCYNEQRFEIKFWGIEAINPLNYYACNSFTLPDLPDNMYYYDTILDDTDFLTTHPGNIIPEGTTYNFSGTANPQVIGPLYIYTSTNNRLACEDENAFSITIYQTPTITPAIPTINDNIYACNNYTLPTLTVGRYYTLPGGPSTPNNVEIASGTNYTSTQPSIYAYAEVGSTNTKICFVEQQIRINIFNVTELPDVPPTCNQYQLRKNGNILPTEDYYLPDGTLLPDGTFITTPGTNTIQVRGNAPSNYIPACTDFSEFTVTIIPTPVANPATIAPICDDFNDITDGLDQFDLTQVQTAVLGTQIPASDFTFTYYTSLGEALNPNSTSAIPTAQLTQYENDTPEFDSVWVRITNNIATNPCFDVTEIRLVVRKTPNPVLKTEYFICNDYATGLPNKQAFLDCGVSGPQFTFVWTREGMPYPVTTGSFFTSDPGNYTVTVRDTSYPENCPKSASTRVTEYAPYITIDYSDAFASPTYITVTVNGPGSGNYDYQLDNGHPQESNTFYNVTPGEHIISVRDRDDHCSPAPLKVVIVNYPKYFTPNDDGYHETWNIKDLVTTNPNAPIFIFDRMGKLIKQITPASPGWNGTYNGQPLPATDYWFTVEFDEKGNNRIFKAHFALKR